MKFTITCTSTYSITVEGDSEKEVRRNYNHGIYNDLLELVKSIYGQPEIEIIAEEEL